MAGLHTNRGAKRAREAREALGLADAPLDCVLSVAERAGCSVVVWRMPAAVAGACFRGGDRAVLHVNGTQPLTRRRFTLAHELGHAWCRHEGRLAPDDAATLNGRTVDPREIEANAFAAELLVPRAALEPLLSRRPGLDEIGAAAARFGVSPIVVVFRCVTCRLVSDDHGARLRREIDAGLHEHAVAGMPLPRVDDRLARIDELPWLSDDLRDSALAGALSGAVSVDAAARAATCAPGALRAALERL